MFASRFFAPRFFAPRFFAEVGYTLVSDVAIEIVEPTGTTNQTIRMREEGGLSFSLPQGSRGTGQVQFVLRSWDTYMPSIRTPIYARQGNAAGVVTTLFAGLISGGISIKFIGDRGDRFVTASIVSLEACFDSLRIKVPRAYFNKTCKYIVEDIFATEGAGTPVMLGTISDGPVVSRVYVHDRLSDIFTELATTAGFIWYVNHGDSSLQFHLPETAAAPFVVTNSDIIYESIDYKQSDQDFRDWQAVQLSFGAAPVSAKLFAGDGVTKAFTVDYPVDSIVAAAITTSVAASATGTQTGQPAAGETFSLDFQSSTGVTSRFVVTAPANQPSNVNFSVQVTAVDDTGAIITTYAGTVHFTTDGSAFDTVPGDSTLTGGRGTFTFKLTDIHGPLPGPPITATITATDTVATTTTGTSGTIVVS